MDKRVASKLNQFASEIKRARKTELIEFLAYIHMRKALLHARKVLWYFGLMQKES